MAKARPSSAYASAAALPGAPRELDRLSAQPVAPIARHVVAKRSRQTREQPRPQLDVLVVQPGQPLLEQRNE
jgi:hypothetical protein